MVSRGFHALSAWAKEPSPGLTQMVRPGPEDSAPAAGIAAQLSRTASIVTMSFIFKRSFLWEWDFQGCFLSSHVIYRNFLEKKGKNT
jgi:hypothetical protein